MIRGFKNFLMRGEVITVAVALVIALAFSTLIKAFTDNIINPILAAFQGGTSLGLGVQLGDKGNPKTYLDSARSFRRSSTSILCAVVYFLIVVPYKSLQARRGVVVYGDPDQDLPGLPVRRPEPGGDALQVLRLGAADRCRLIIPVPGARQSFVVWRTFVVSAPAHARRRTGRRPTHVLLVR